MPRKHYFFLKKAMEDKAYETAFRSALDLKGLVGNLSLNALFHETSLLIGALRSGNDISQAVQLFSALTDEYTLTVEAIQKAKEA